VERILYDDETGRFMIADLLLLQGLRDTFEVPSDDDEYVAEFDELERHGWREATPLTIAMALGDVHDEESLAAWRALQADDPVTLTNAIVRLTEVLRSGAYRQPLSAEVAEAAPKVDSPYFTKEEAASYLRTTVSGIYGRVERGRLQRCRGINDYLFTREMLDESAMGRVQTPARRRRGR
jgi:hypothetical protein